MTKILIIRDVPYLVCATPDQSHLTLVFYIEYVEGCIKRGVLPLNFTDWAINEREKSTDIGAGINVDE